MPIKFFRTPANVSRSYVNMAATTVAVASALLLGGLCGCESYDVTINDKLVYGPARLYRDFDMPDLALRECVSQAIADQKISSPLDLTALNCSNAGISNLEGLATFAAIKQLKLSDNQIRNLVILEQIPELQQLWLDNNGIIDPVPLAQLADLQSLNLAGNSQLQCPKPGLLAGIAEITLPTHCTAPST